MNELNAPTVDTSPSNQLEPTNTPANPSSYKPEPAEEPKPEKPLTARQALEKAAAEAEGAKPAEVKPKSELKVEAKAEPKPGAKAEPVRAEPARENGRFVSTKEQPEPSASTAEDGAGQDGGEGNRPSEGRDHNAPPARFLPRAKEQWANVPDDVKGEVHRALENAEKGMAEYKESHEFRKELKQFEDMAKASGTTVKQAIENYVNIDQQLRTQPEQALERILKSINLTPQQYAQHVLGQQQQRQQNPALEHTQRLEQQVQQLGQQIQQLTQGTHQDRESARLQQVQQTIIEPFKAAHPRFSELEGDIAFFLNSDKIPSTLNERQRLETAYDMAERINPAPHLASNARLTAAPAQKPINPAGERSIKGAPGADDNVVGDKGKMKPRDAIRAAAAELGINM